MAGRAFLFISFLMMVGLLLPPVLPAQTTRAGSDSTQIAVPKSQFSQKISDSFWGADKAQHFMGSLMSTVLVHQILHRSCKRDFRSSRNIAIGFSFSLGILKEIRDSRQPGNHFSWKDLLADVAGIAAGVVLLSQP